jgi:hypothetical protein
LKKRLARGDLSTETIKKIEFENRGKRLGHGYFYDGSKFRNEDGLVVDHHPCNLGKDYLIIGLDELVHEFLERENDLIDKDNFVLEQQWKTYVKAFS